MLPKLPLELCIDVMEDVYYNPNGSVDFPSVSACSRVCSSWAEHGQKLLFRFVEIGHDESAKYHTLLAQIDPCTDRGKILGSYIRMLNIHVGVVSSPKCGLSSHEFIRLLSFCSRIYCLTLHSGIYKFTTESVNSLRNIAAKTNLRALNLAECGRQSPILYQLLSIWPSIQFLRIGCGFQALPPSAQSKIQLYELVLSCGEHMPSQTLDWLLSSSQTSLEILELWDEVGPQMKNLVAKHSKYLRSLRIPCHNKVCAEAVDLCPKLEELALVVYQSTAFTQFRNLPSSIQHFAIHNSANRPLHHPVISAIDTLPNLRVVSCDEKTREQPGFAALQKACDARYVYLKVEHTRLSWTVGV